MNKIVKRRIADLIPYANNAKEHTPKQIENLKKSLTEFGWVCPCIIKNNVLIVGHGRIQAAKELGWEYAECIERNDLTDEQADAYRLLDNLLSEGGYDGEKIKTELQTVDLSGYDFSEIDVEIQGINVPTNSDHEEIEIEENEVPDLEEEVITKLGDKWQLGDHILLCGSSTDPEDVKNLMGGVEGKILFTSPPYSDMREYEGGKDLAVDSLAQFIPTYKPYAEYQCVNLGLQRKDYDIVQYWDEYIRSAKECGYKLMAWNVWDKGSASSVGQQTMMFPCRHEWIFVFGNDKLDLNKTWKKQSGSIKVERNAITRRQKDGTMKRSSWGDTSSAYKKMESVVQCVVESGKIRGEHPAVFPIGLPSSYIQAMTDEGDIVIEPFGGSGTTLIACEQLNRKCRIMELEPKYCDVIVRRWENLTGNKAVLINE